MTYGMQISASGAQAALFRQDALAANLANINTAGFKPILAEAMHRDYARAEDNLWNLPSDVLLEQLGGGVFSAPTVINFKQAPLETTDQPLDLGIQGDGFFTVGNPDNPALTRDGRLTLDASGRLVMATSGLPILDVAGREIHIDPALGELIIDSDGQITQNGAPIARIRLADVPDRSVLIKLGEGLFAHETGAKLPLIDAPGAIRQGTLETSGVDEISAMLGITAASKAAQSNISMLDMQNRMLDRLVNQFARLS
ncbi:MAG: flagellar hook-basal body protein [Planctomycetota bacterium]|nr:MAG: flagellar hook-basal body protein [Planctomycetota bacterium]